MKLTDEQKQLIPLLFTGRDTEILEACIDYQQGPSPGFPGHHLILVVANLCRLYEVDPKVLRELTTRSHPEPPEANTTTIREGGAKAPFGWRHNDETT